MSRPVRQEFEFHDARKTMAESDRRNAIRQGYGDFQFFGWHKDPPYPEGDPRRWCWQDGAEMADQVHRTGRGRLQETPGWI